MRRILLLLIIAGSLATTSAMAADLVANGTIKSMDAKACTVTLAPAAVYTFPAKCDFSKLKADEKVSITYVVNGKVNSASKIAMG